MIEIDDDIRTLNKCISQQFQPVAHMGKVKATALN